MSKDKKNKLISLDFTYLIKTFIPLLGMFSALLYFLGRLHTESYYYSLGITPNVLSLSAYDYMFSSFELVIMCLLVVIFLYCYWRISLPEVNLFLGFPIKDKEKTQNTVTDPIQKKKLLGDIRSSKIRIIVCYAMGLVFLYWLAFVPTPTIFDQKGVIGFYSGIVVGLGALLFAYLLKVRRHGKNQGVKILAIILVLLVALPFVTARIADKEKQRDIDLVFPVVTVTYNDESYNESFNSSLNNTKSISGKLVLTNNSITYILESDNITTIAIPEDNIINIIYTKTFRYYEYP